METITIHSVEEYDKFSDETFKRACALDLTYEEEHFLLMEGLLIIMTADTLDSTKILFMPSEDFWSLTKDERDYITG